MARHAPCPQALRNQLTRASSGAPISTSRSTARTLAAYDEPQWYSTIASKLPLWLLGDCDFIVLAGTDGSAIASSPDNASQHGQILPGRDDLRLQLQLSSRWRGSKIVDSEHSTHSAIQEKSWLRHGLQGDARAQVVDGGLRATYTDVSETLCE